MPCRHLCTSMALNVICGPCKSMTLYVSVLGPLMMQVVTFCIACILCISWLLVPANTPLQLDSWLFTNACIKRRLRHQGLPDWPELPCMEETGLVKFSTSGHGYPTRSSTTVANCGPWVYWTAVMCLWEIQFWICTAQLARGICYVNGLCVCVCWHRPECTRHESSFNDIGPLRLADRHPL